MFLESKSAGGFPQAIYDMITRDRKLAQRVINSILQAHFSESIHSDILDVIGIDELTELVAKGRSRNPIFRENVLKAYEYRCAVCGFNARLENILVGIEAAHIKWFKAGGSFYCHRFTVLKNCKSTDLTVRAS